MNTFSGVQIKEHYVLSLAEQTLVSDPCTAFAFERLGQYLRGSIIGSGVVMSYLISPDPQFRQTEGRSSLRSIIRSRRDAERVGDFVRRRPDSLCESR
jgi:hypothetical protein